VARYLRKIGVRKDAYPFDWILTSAPTAIQLIANDFEGFMELDSLLFLPPKKRTLFGDDLKATEAVVTPMVCQRYGIWSMHDFSERGKADYPAVKEKFNRRVARLRQAIQDNSHKVFVYVIPSEVRREEYRREGMTFTAEYTPSDAQAAFAALGLKDAELVLLDDLSRRLGPAEKRQSLASKIKARLRGLFH
jgi:hypothetical protein